MLHNSLPPSHSASLPVYTFCKVWICCGLMKPGLFLSLFFFKEAWDCNSVNYFPEPRFCGYSTARGRGTERGPRKSLSRKSNFIIEKSSVLNSLHHRHKFTYSICRRNGVGPICIMLLEGLTLLLNLNVAGARKQLLSCRRWQGERPSDGFRLQTSFARAAHYRRPGSQAEGGSQGWEKSVWIAFSRLCLQPGRGQIWVSTFGFPTLIIGTIVSLLPRWQFVSWTVLSLCLCHTFLPLSLTHLQVPTRQVSQGLLTSCQQSSVSLSEMLN